MAFIQEVRGLKPKIAEKVYLSPNVSIIGDVEIAEGASIWFQSVIRGDVNSIRIGKNTNIQDACVIHATYKDSKTILEDNISVGHRSILHGCTIRSNCLIGMGAIIMDHAEIPSNSLVAAGSLVTAGASFSPGHLILGSPAKAVRKLKKEEIELIENSVENYLFYKTWYL